MAQMNDHKPSTNKLASHNKSYDVFLSFRGPDVRKTLVDHLFTDLTRAGVRVFLDNERLQKGENIGYSLRQAIQDSAIHIPIFSPKYAESYWCLEEVTEISKSQGLIIPLFYGVEPSHVRYPHREQSPSAAAFKEHSNKREYNDGQYTPRYSPETIAAWKEALRQVSDFAGWSLDTTSGYQAQLVGRVVSDILNTLSNVPFVVNEQFVGVGERMAQVLDLLKIEEARHRVLTVAIGGIGGVGKTTVAKAIFCEIYLKFDAACFLSDVRENAEERRGLKKLQKQILKKLLGENICIDSVDHGRALMQFRLGSKRSLLVLDDVGNPNQMEALGVDPGPGSRVIITTRDKGVLTLGEDPIYHMEALQHSQALALFNWHAFGTERPDDDYRDLSAEVVKGCGGIPLALQVLGAFLRRKKDRRCWSEAAKMVHKDVYESLQISFDDLSHEKKQIFLGIAGFFIGRRTEEPIIFWKASEWNAHTAVDNLKLKMLINISDDEGIFVMHDQIRDMGREIVKNESPDHPGRRSRLWNLHDVCIVISSQQGMENVRCFCISNEFIKTMTKQH